MYNFGAGPAMLPKSLLEQARDELLNWHGMGLSILELGHRTPEFMALMESMEADLRDVLSIPNNYRVLFMGVAARFHFSMIPVNFLQAGEQAGYCITGLWSAMAFQEAERLSKAYCVARSEEPYTKTPLAEEWKLEKNTAYLYYTPNETLSGIQFGYTPICSQAPLIADMTSCLLSEPINVADFALIYAGTQKNIAPAGLSIVIVRDDLLEKSPLQPLATMMDYRTHAKHNSLYATPPVFNCYFAAKMFTWIKEQGGLSAVQARNQRKAAKLYQYIDASPYYHCAIEPGSRSVMNVCFSLGSPALDEQFVSLARQEGLYALKGHRLVGGLRASLYNAMPMEGVDALIDFMQQFSERYCQ